MPQFVSGAPRATIPANAAIGFFGKIPVRGDFVRMGLPRGFADPWDGWMERMLAGSRSEMGEEWLPAWLEGPVWRFALSPGICGAEAVLGVWMPSVDRVGRYFPLTLAVVATDAASEMILRGGGLLAALEAAGLDAIERGSQPEELAASVAASAAATPADADVDPALCPVSGALWWTAGATRVPPRAFASRALPNEVEFVAMLDAREGVTP